jgi:hypothetical protein
MIEMNSQDERFEMFSDESQFRAKLMVWGGLTAFVLFVALPWLVGAIKIMAWIFS